MSLTIEGAWVRFHTAVAAYKAHQETGTELKEREIVARRTMPEQADNAKAEYEAHQRKWLDLYNAEKDAAAALVTMFDLSPEEKSAMKRAL